MKKNWENHVRFDNISSERILIEHLDKLKGIQKQLNSVQDQLSNVRMAYDDLAREFRKQRHKAEPVTVSLEGFP